MRRAVPVLALALAGWLTIAGYSIWTFGNRSHARPSDCAIG
jgi:hypothetical protein